MYHGYFDLVIFFNIKEPIIKLFFKQKEIVNFTDIFSFHSVRDTKIIGDNDDLEKKYLNAKEQLELSDDYYEDWLMWY